MPAQRTLLVMACAIAVAGGCVLAGSGLAGVGLVIAALLLGSLAPD